MVRVPKSPHCNGGRPDRMSGQLSRKRRREGAICVLGCARTMSRWCMMAKNDDTPVRFLSSDSSTFIGEPF